MSLHTMTLTSPTLPIKAYKQIKDQIYTLISLDSMRCCCKVKHQFIRIYHRSVPSLGITLWMPPFPRLEMRLNPSVLLGNSYADLCDTDEKVLQTCQEIIDCVLQIMHVPFCFQDMILSRIDCTKDIDFTPYGSIESLLRCVKRTHLPYQYHSEHFSSAQKHWKEKNQHSFRAKSPDIDLTIYDKSFQLSEEGLMPLHQIPPNRLRMECAFDAAAFQRLFSSCTPNPPPKTLPDKIQFFSDHSNQLLQKYFGQVLTPGDYLRYDEALDRINSSHFQTSTKKNMAKFIRNVQCFRSIDTASAHLLEQGWTPSAIYSLLSHFQDLHLNPAILPASYPYEQIPAITTLLGIQPIGASDTEKPAVPDSGTAGVMDVNPLDDRL